MRHISVIPSALGPKDKDGKITQKGKREGCESFRFFTKKFSDFIHVTEKKRMKMKKKELRKEGTCLRG
jgi:hypothetical protein